MRHIHHLAGCTPAPLAHYLKALGVLRLVAEQRDSLARGWWKDECFHLATTLDRNALMKFLLEEYEPSPITSPWNKGAGFFATKDPGLAPIETSTAPRLRPLRQGVSDARALLGQIAAADAVVRMIKAETKRKGLNASQRQKLRADPEYRRRLAEAERSFAARKAGLIPRCRLAWRGVQRRWMDAAVILADEAKPAYPALLGTGGNDGNFDFTNNYYQRVIELFDMASGHPRQGAAESFAAALWGVPERALRRGIAAGQHFPGTAGGANSGNGPRGDSSVNPVDFVLMLEGALLFTGHVTRRLDAEGRAQAAAPFAVTSTAAGYASAGQADEGPRGEQWMPIWEAPSTVTELQQLLAEGRSRLDRTNVRKPLAFARAAARLGVARGIRAFQRFGYIERNGQSNLAIPLGRFVVPDRPPKLLGLIDQIDVWLQQLQRQAGDEHAPARLRAAEHRLSEALFAVVQHPDEPVRWQRLLLALADVEAVMASGSGFHAGPVPRLSPDWVDAANDGSAELRLAVAFALQGMEWERGRWDGIRRHWLPLDDTGRRFDTTGDAMATRLKRKPDVVLGGRDGVTDAIALVERRLVEAAQRGTRHLPLDAAPGAAARLTDLAALLAGEVNVDRTLALARALMALEIRAWRGASRAPKTASAETRWPDDAWLLLRLALLPWSLDERTIGADPAIVRRLATGDPGTGFELARRRLGAAGIRAAVRLAAVDTRRARLWAAALAFPISPRTALSIARRIDPLFATKGTQA